MVGNDSPGSVVNGVPEHGGEDFFPLLADGSAGVARLGAEELTDSGEDCWR